MKNSKVVVEDASKWQKCPVCEIFFHDSDAYEQCFRCSQVEKTMIKETADADYENNLSQVREKLTAKAAKAKNSYAP